MALRARKIPFYLTVFLSTLGASLIIALLSFGGMWAFMLDLGIKWSMAALLTGSLTAAFFSGVFEMEIYWQNTKKACGKMVNGDYLRDFFADKFFKKFYLNNSAVKNNEADKPQFLADYDICTKQLSILNKLKEKLTKQIGEAQKIPDRKMRKVLIAQYESEFAAHKITEKKILKNQKALKKIFTQVLFSKYIDSSDTANAYKLALKNWLQTGEREPKQAKIQNKLDKRERRYFGAKIFSVLASLASGVGTLFLLSSIFETVPVIALFVGPLIASPVGIILMSIVAGMAYGMLTFNSITDMMDNKTVQKWRKNFFGDGLKYEHNPRTKKVAMMIIGASLFLLAGFISVCTAGTWWMATKNLPGFLSFLKGTPARVINAFRLTISIVIGTATLIFDLENTSQSLDILHKGLGGGFYKKFEEIRTGFKNLWNSEWTIEKFNPFRALLIVTVLVVQVVLFVGHLVCMGVDSDQTPWDISESFLTFWSSILEIATDAHYVAEIFGGHNHDAKKPCTGHAHGAHSHDEEKEEEAHGHEHRIDIPKIVAIAIAYTLFWLPAKIWSEVFGRIRCYFVNRAAKAEAKVEKPAVAAAVLEEATPTPASTPTQAAATAQQAVIDLVPVSEPVIVPEPPIQTLMLSPEGQAEVACYKLQKQSNNHINRWFGSTSKAIAVDKHQVLIKEEIKKDAESRTKKVEDLLDDACQDRAISAHRGFGFFGYKNADTHNRIKGIKEEVSVQVSTAAAA